MQVTRRRFSTLLFGPFLTSGSRHLFAQASSPRPPASSAPGRPEIAPADRIAPAVLAKAIQESLSPLVLAVGPRTFYDQAHILGSEYVGATGTDAGLEALKTRVAETARDRWIVVYCGCCPWDRCPNIRPAFQELRALGFARAQALYLPNNFGADWVASSYPTEH